MNYLLLPFLLISFLTFAQDEKPMKLKEKSAEVIFLRKVELAVRAHDADQLMSYMQPDYKRSQHDEFLEGRTLQFLTEFFCSEIPFDQIQTATLIRYTPLRDSKNQYEVVFYISNGIAACNSTFFMSKHPSTGVFSIFSAVG